ncbi:MAG: GGDEF domain-containing protein [Lachnospiraceae bacterium]|nr:GGDEF domain-containing protein [Lachnospiraceae bacterium]
MNCAKRFWQFINKDVENANETKKVAVITRLFSLIMCIYFVIVMAIMGFSGNFQEVAAGAVFCSVYAFLFYCSYVNTAKHVMVLVQVLTFVWLIYGVHTLGWSFGVQNLLLALLVYGLLTSYRGVKFKLFMAGAASVMMVGLYEYDLLVATETCFDSVSAGAMQWLSVILNMTLVTVLILMFSHNSQDMEKKLIDYNEKIRKMASVDPLTGLKNRRAMMEAMENFVKSGETEKQQFSIAIGDIDFFKKINDTYGHDVGDEVLIAIAGHLNEYMADKGLVARWGGEEFLLLFWGMNGDNVYMELEKIRSRLEKVMIKHEEEDISVTMTFGMDEYDPSHPIDYTISSADKKLYIGKKTGRNKVVF